MLYAFLSNKSGAMLFYNNWDLWVMPWYIWSNDSNTFAPSKLNFRSQVIGFKIIVYFDKAFFLLNFFFVFVQYGASGKISSPPKYISFFSSSSFPFESLSHEKMFTIIRNFTNIKLMMIIFHFQNRLLSCHDRHLTKPQYLIALPESISKGVHLRSLSFMI